MSQIPWKHLAFVLMGVSIPGIASGSGEVSLWKGENNAQDSMGSNDGVENGTVNYIAGASGMAFDLSGDDWVAVASPVSGGVAETSGFSILVWAVQDVFVAGAAIVNLRAASNDSGFSLEAHPSDADLLVFKVNTSGTTTFASTSLNFTLGAGHGVAATFSAATQTLKMYHDAQVVSNTAAGGTAMILDGDEVFEIGRNIPSAAKWIGTIDELRYYDVALTADQVAAAFAGTLLFVNGFESGSPSSWSATAP